MSIFDDVKVEAIRVLRETGKEHPDYKIGVFKAYRQCSNLPDIGNYNIHNREYLKHGEDLFHRLAGDAVKAEEEKELAVESERDVFFKLVREHAKTYGAKETLLLVEIAVTEGDIV